LLPLAPIPMGFYFGFVFNHSELYFLRGDEKESFSEILESE
tara:strand:- start:177 stop:299 length:123 start_codon:yes stop_codon:yes gene_type:complete